MHLRHYVTDDLRKKYRPGTQIIKIKSILCMCKPPNPQKTSTACANTSTHSQASVYNIHTLVLYTYMQGSTEISLRRYNFSMRSKQIKHSNDHIKGNQVRKGEGGRSTCCPPLWGKHCEGACIYYLQFEQHYAYSVFPPIRPNHCRPVRVEPWACL